MRRSIISQGGERVTHSVKQSYYNLLTEIGYNSAYSISLAHGRS